MSHEDPITRYDEYFRRERRIQTAILQFFHIYREATSIMAAAEQIARNNQLETNDVAFELGNNLIRQGWLVRGRAGSLVPADHIHEHPYYPAELRVEVPPSQYELVERRRWFGQALLNQIGAPNGEKLRKLYTDNWPQIAAAPGSSQNHHAWRGGYLDHIRQVNQNVALLTNQLRDTGAMRKLPTAEKFSVDEALVVSSLHDIEKPFRYLPYKQINPDIATKQQRADFRLKLIGQMGIRLTDQQENALQFAEGMRDADYQANARVMSPMAAVVHAADLLSARAQYSLN